MSHDESEISRRIKFDQKLPAPPSDAERKTPVAPRTTFGSEQNIGIEKKLRRVETKIEVDIKRKLRNIYQKNISAVLSTGA